MSKEKDKEPVVLEDFDETELTGDNAEVYTFQWLASTENKLGDVLVADLKSQQQTLESTLLKIVSYPNPGRAIRNLVGRCFVKIYTRGETRTMFDSLQACMRIVGDFKSEKEARKIAAFAVIGDIMNSFGSQVMSFMAEICTVVLKTVKSSNSTLLRTTALHTLHASLRTAKRAVTDSLAKDVLKQVRSLLGDKAFAVQRAACEVLIAIYTPSPSLSSSSSDQDPHAYPTLSEIDTLISTSLKSIESADQITRFSHSQLIGHVLASTQVERAVPSAPQKKDKDGKKGEEEEEEGAVGAAAQEAEKKPLCTAGEMLLHISNQYNRPHTSRKTRIAIFDFYMTLLTRLGPSFIESNYSLLVSHLLNEILNSPRTLPSDVPLIRTLLSILLRDLIGVRMLSEQGQMDALKELATMYLKRWPVLLGKGGKEPGRRELVSVLEEVGGLIGQLGSLPSGVQESLADPLVTLLSHPSHTVRIHSAWALRCFCYATPLRLAKCIQLVMEKLNRDLGLLLTSSSNNPSSSNLSSSSLASTSDIPARALGHTHALSALISLIPHRPLYISYDISARLWDISTSLLKKASEHPVATSIVEIEVAWTLIAALMSLGPQFVKVHLSQMLVLWRNALPKPTRGEEGRGRAEWEFLMHVRESALSAIACFLEHNRALVTLDVARRVASVLSNALSFANGFLSANLEEDPLLPPPSSNTPKKLTLRDREALLRRRVYQCFSLLGFSSIVESTQGALLQSAVSLFASPDGYAGSSVQAAIASSSGAFVSVWSSVDGYGYGVTSKAYEVLDEGEGGEGDVKKEGRDKVVGDIDSMLRKPIIPSLEHDALLLFSAPSTLAPATPPANTAVVDAAIDLFARLLPLQDQAGTVKIITQLLDSVRSQKLDKNAGRKAAVQINACVALVLALRNAMTGGGGRGGRETFGSEKVTTLLGPFLKDALIDGDALLRSAASECIGRLSSLSGTTFLTGQIKDLVDTVVNNRDPYGRAGCALAFGAIYTHVGGLAAGPLLKTTVNVLMSLSNDPHPVVHFWALNALARVINAASLAYAPFVSSTLGMLLKVYLLESHEREGGTLGNSNVSGECPAYPVVCQIIDAVITVLGPDIQESPRTRTLILNLVHEFSLEDDEGISIEAIKCIQHFLMFAPEFVDIPELVQRFRAHLSSSRRPLKLASINALYQLVQKDALTMSRIGGDRLVEDLFGMLDDDSSVQGVRNVISSWLQQTVIHNPSAWIDLCQRIMSRTTAAQQVVDANTRDDEGESLNLGENATKGRLTSRWRTQLFALECLHDICVIVADSGRKEHLNAVVARMQGVQTNGLLFTRVADLIRMAFTASTAYVTEIRLEGLVVLQDVIQIFAESPDPAYDDALLLEQHQAPITAALTPAFTTDSTPEILASAVHACAVFVGCGVVKDVGRMGRILRLLTTALEQSKEAGMLSVGESGELSPNASAMLRISTLSAWAQLQVSSEHQAYLQMVVEPYRLTLSSLWISSLRDYASIRIDSDLLNDTSSVALDSSYSNLGKEVLLPYYNQAWPIILQAVATTMQAGEPHILAAMDGRELAKDEKPPAPDTKREEPTALFFVIYGLVYEALTTSAADSAVASSARDTIVISALKALKSLVRPEYSGNAIMEPTIFDEFISLCYRMAMTESAGVQVHLVEVVGALAATRSPGSTDSLSLTSPRAHCLRICAHILKHSTSLSRGSIIQGQVADRLALINAAFSSIISVASSINSSQREDVRGVSALLYCDILKDESSEIDLAGPTFPSLKSIIDLPVASSKDNEQYNQLIHALLSTCLHNVDEMRGRQGLISAKKIRNNLLAAVLILTVVPLSVKVGRAALEHCCFLISQKLLDVDEISLTAAHCTKTLILASAAGNGLLRQCCRLLLPGLIEFLAKMSPSVHDGSIKEAHVTAIGEVWKALSAFFSSVGEEHRSRVLGVLLPTISLLLLNPQAPSTPLNTQTIAQLLSFATASPVAFKEAAGKLDPATRELLEQSIRRAVGGTTAATTQPAAKPQISLRAF